MKSLKQIQEEELKKFDELYFGDIYEKEWVAELTSFKEVRLNDDLKQFLLSAMESSARGAIESMIENLPVIKHSGFLDLDLRDKMQKDLSIKARDYLGDTHD